MRLCCYFEGKAYAMICFSILNGGVEMTVIFLFRNFSYLFIEIARKQNVTLRNVGLLFIFKLSNKGSSPESFPDISDQIIF